MEKKQVCILLTADQFEALSSFARNEDEFANMIWTSIFRKAQEAGLIKVKAKPTSKPIWMQDRERIELLKELVLDECDSAWNDDISF